MPMSASTRKPPYGSERLPKKLPSTLALWYVQGRAALRPIVGEMGESKAFCIYILTDGPDREPNVMGSIFHLQDGAWSFTKVDRIDLARTWSYDAILSGSFNDRGAPCVDHTGACINGAGATLLARVLIDN
jgi:hypothetical protein